jgi:hypothetical protein
VKLGVRYDMYTPNSNIIQRKRAGAKQQVNLNSVSMKDALLQIDLIQCGSVTPDKPSEAAAR